MKHDKWKVFIPAIFTMMGMHILSVGIGTIFPLLFSRNSIVYFSVFLFILFGIMMIYEAYHLKPKSAEEKVKELQNDLLSKSSNEIGIEMTVINSNKQIEESKEIKHSNSGILEPEFELKIEKNSDLNSIEYSNREIDFNKEQPKEKVILLI